MKYLGITLTKKAEYFCKENYIMDEGNYQQQKMENYC